MSESFAELFEESFASQQIKPGAIITGTVVAVNDDVVIVSAGLKSEAVIPIEQFKNDKSEGEISVGDEVEVALDAVEDGFGETKLSREKAKRAEAWKELESAHEADEVVKAGLVADAGLLDDGPATTHWAALDLLAGLGTNIEVRPDDRFVDRGGVITAAGVSAGIDMALHLIARLHSVERARAVRRYIQYDPEPPI